MIELSNPIEYVQVIDEEVYYFIKEKKDNEEI